MIVDLKIPWKRYALISELAIRLDEKCPQFGKTVLQKMIYLLQEVFEIDCGYDFKLYTYGPFTAQILYDLDFVEHNGGVTVQPVNDDNSGYQISPGNKADYLLERGKDFITKPEVIEALTRLVDEFGCSSAKSLELRSTIVYVEREFKGSASGSPPRVEKVISAVEGVKPKFTKDDIRNAVDELRNKSYINLS
jgi:uncharacterized protein YwgA